MLVQIQYSAKTPTQDISDRHLFLQKSEYKRHRLLCCYTRNINTHIYSTHHTHIHSHIIPKHAHTHTHTYARINTFTRTHTRTRTHIYCTSFTSYRGYAREINIQTTKRFHKGSFHKTPLKIHIYNPQTQFLLKYISTIYHRNGKKFNLSLHICKKYF